MVGAADAHGGTGRTNPRGAGSPRGDTKKAPQEASSYQASGQAGPMTPDHWRNPVVRLLWRTQAPLPKLRTHPPLPFAWVMLGLCTLFRDGTVPACMQEYARDCISRRDCNLALPRTHTSSLLSARVRVF